ncbi:hypothetical protein MKX83_24520 [Cytobacillus sp. FSL M8-0252]|uniref:hypothetical protein n=1 Tax=Cytobacillus sp. FSL M8-0252 TaxID=2921621 RepID=UPI0030F674FE
MMSIDERLGEVEEKTHMLNVLSRITSSLLVDDEYTKKAAADELIEFMNSQMKKIPYITENR